MDNSKSCTKCGQTKAVNEFIASFDKKRNKTYISNVCRLCKNAYLNSWQRNNKDKVAQYARTFRAKHPEKCKEWLIQSAPKRNERLKIRRSITSSFEKDNRQQKRFEKLELKRANRLAEDKICTFCKQKIPRMFFYDDATRWDGKQAKCKACCALLSSNWGQRNPEKLSDARARRRALMRNCDIRLVTVKDIRRMLSNSCAYCDKPSEHIDHIIPLAKNGRHAIGNLTGACSSCNLSKRDKLIVEWQKGKNEAR